MLIFITAPPQHAVCLLPPAPACGQPCAPVWRPLMPTPLAVASVPRMVMLGVAEVGKFGFVFSSTAR